MKDTIYFWVANIIFIGHLCFGLFVLSGWYFNSIELIYLLVLTAWMSCWVFLGYCPVSRWEFTLRNKYDSNIEPNTDIMSHYINKILGTKVTKDQVVRVGMCVFLVLVLATYVS